ncbi:hypothetical protein [Streptomyces sp. NPDC087859]|uniref:hypothetical protein n=1 Tax=Streptomyces sp. NPDC087859 TaxID=3365812 RepID=UPI00382BFA83
MLFKSEGQKQLEALIDDLVRSHLRGAVRNSPEGRAEICQEMSRLADELLDAGKDRAVRGARRYQSPLYLGLPPHAQREMDRMVAEALS